MKSYFPSVFGRGRPLRLAISVACDVAFVLFGYDQAVFSGIVGNDDFRATFGRPDSALQGIVVAIYNLGCLAGCLAAFVCCERTGRRWAMWLAMGFVIVSDFFLFFFVFCVLEEGEGAQVWCWQLLS